MHSRHQTAEAAIGNKHLEQAWRRIKLSQCCLHEWSVEQLLLQVHHAFLSLNDKRAV